MTTIPEILDDREKSTQVRGKVFMLEPGKDYAIRGEKGNLMISVQNDEVRVIFTNGEIQKKKLGSVFMLRKHDRLKLMVFMYLCFTTDKPMYKGILFI